MNITQNIELLQILKSHQLFVQVVTIIPQNEKNMEDRTFLWQQKCRVYLFYINFLHQIFYTNFLHQFVSFSLNTNCFSKKNRFRNLKILCKKNKIFGVKKCKKFLCKKIDVKNAKILV